MAFLALVDAPLSSESMKFPVFSLLTGNFETETSSHVTPPSSGESRANLRRAGMPTSDVEELLAERGLDVSYETVRLWVLKFGPVLARRLALGF